ncbi:MAG TPA: DUF4349 domain-containing protein [Candidatus Nanoarchaeia archaeon]|nr:DUF4349 domain-containing protein [Candidatus Nanoarchaeia archaeon]
MKIKDFVAKIKKNWFVLTLILAVLIVSTVMNSNSLYSQEPWLYDDSGYRGEKTASSARIIAGPYEQDWQPEIKRREIEKNAYLSLETKRGKFQETDEALKSLVKLSDSFILYVNVNNYDGSNYGSYTIKVASQKYEFFLTQAKALGTVLSFNDQAQDVTGQIISLEETLVKEKQYLADLKILLEKARSNDEKIKLREQIANQERYIQSLEESYEGSKNRVIYSTVVVDLKEAPSRYGEIGLIGFSELLKKLVSSFNAVLRWLFGILPWSVLGFLIWLVVKLVKKRI